MWVWSFSGGNNRLSFTFFFFIKKKFTKELSIYVSLAIWKTITQFQEVRSSIRSIRCMSTACISLCQTLGFSRSRLLYENRLSDKGCYHFPAPCEYPRARSPWTRMDHANIHHGVTVIALISITPDRGATFVRDDISPPLLEVRA